MRKVKVVMMNKTITIKRANLINTKRTTKMVNMKRSTSISKRKVSTPKRIVAHLKKAMNVSPIVIEKR